MKPNLKAKILLYRRGDKVPHFSTRERERERERESAPKNELEGVSSDMTDANLNEPVHFPSPKFCL
jgi:hypothetical protein